MQSFRSFLEKITYYCLYLFSLEVAFNLEVAPTMKIPNRLMMYSKNLKPSNPTLLFYIVACACHMCDCEL